MRELDSGQIRDCARFLPLLTLCKQTGFAVCYESALVRAISYLIVAIDYALSCQGTCPTCVLSTMERASTTPATSVDKIAASLADIAARYDHIGTLALGIGRGNVLMLNEDSVEEIAAIAEAAKKSFNAGEVILEISTSLVGKIDPQIARARQIMAACSDRGVDARFVVVANTALTSPKYWANLDNFLTTLAADRGDGDGSGDILQLALAIGSLPTVDDLISHVGQYRSPINLTWAPAFDKAAAEQSSLDLLGRWLAEFYEKVEPLNLDSSLVNRLRQAFDNTPFGIHDLAHHVEESSRAVVYIAPDGTWHHGLFTILAEMDPIRFDPFSVRDRQGRARIVESASKEIGRLLRNPACRGCPFSDQCVASGAFQVGLMTLRHYPSGTDVCPSTLRPSFEKFAGYHAAD